jgi:hypothetical protein
MRKLAEAASNLEFPTLRKVNLIPEEVRDPGSRCPVYPLDLHLRQQWIEEPIPTLFRAGNVELVLEEDDREDIQSLVEWMHKDA